MRIDAHQHYWKIERNDYGWLTPESGVLYRDYLPDDLHAHLANNQINKTIVVQAAPTIPETEFLLALCERDETIAGVVGWLDLEAEDFSMQFERLAANPYFLGVRPMLQDVADDRYILRPKVLTSLALLVDRAFPIDLLVMPRHLPNILTLLDKLPKLRGVIDHLAKPFIASETLEPWKTHMQQIAQFPSIYCKLSGMVTETKPNNWSYRNLIPYVQHVIRVFGAKRVMFGSDWPVCLLQASYEEVHQALLDSLPQGLTNEELQALFGHNAIDFYRLSIKG